MSQTPANWEFFAICTTSISKMVRRVEKTAIAIRLYQKAFFSMSRQDELYMLVECDECGNTEEMPLMRLSTPGCWSEEMVNDDLRAAGWFIDDDGDVCDRCVDKARSFMNEIGEMCSKVEFEIRTDARNSRDENE